MPAKQSKKYRNHRGSRAGSPLRKGPSISLVMIVKDEERMLPRCLASVGGVVDELIVVDTGSTDSTRAIAAEHGAKVSDFAWCDDFAAARNHALALASGDWVLHLDADEALDPITASRLRGLAAAAPAAIWAYSLPVVSAVQENGHEAEAVAWQKRLFRRLPDAAYLRAVHEEILRAGRPVTEGIARTGVVRVLHEGYRDEEFARRKLALRNLPLLLRAHQADPTEHYYLLELSIMASLTGEAERAADFFARGFEAMDDLARHSSELLPAAACELMRVLTDAGRYQDAFNAGVPLLQYQDVPDLHFRLGQLLLRTGQIVRAAESFAAARAAHGGTKLNLIPGATGSAALWELTTCDLLQGDAAAGLTHAAEALPLLPDERLLLPRIALFALRAGDRAASVSCLRRAGVEVAEETDAGLYGAMLQAFAAVGDHYGIVAVTGDLLADGVKPETLRQRAAAYAALGFHKQAADDLERLRELLPADGTGARALGAARLALGDRRGALTAFSEATRLDSSDAAAWLTLGGLVYDQGALLDASAAARHALELEPGNAGARRLLAQCLRESGDLPQACETLIVGLEEDPADKESRLLLVSLLDTAGARDDALLVMAQALDYHPRDAEVYARLGRMLLDRDRTDDAFDAFHAALGLDPGAETLREAFAALQTLTARRTMEARPAAPAGGLGLRFGRAAIKAG